MVMTRKEQIIVLGGGGHAKVVIDALNAYGKYKIAAVLDPSLKKKSKVLGVKVGGGDVELSCLFDIGIKNCVVAVGSVGNIDVRKRIYLKAKKLGFIFPVIIHPQAVVSKNASLGEGTFVSAGAAINPGVAIGVCCVINTGAVVEHDCTLGDFVHVSPNATLCGNVTVGDGTHVGAGATVIEGFAIGNNSLIGAASLVAGNIGNGWLCYGVPAKKIKSR
jgi:sugar O-acyltransferase (sialic acid O-acetyltransferase NeuD family)